MAYFLISVSNKTNLDLCIQHAIAGFTNNVSGLWTFFEIQRGDLISFLYGARVFNLYQVIDKKAFRNAENLPPAWLPITFKTSGKTYYFPFRLFLKPIRKLNESMVRPEFAYVAENLLLRGGYKKTHFHADQTTLHAVSQMGDVYTDIITPLNLLSYETFIPKVTWNKNMINIPEVFKFHELILQSLIRRYLSDANILQTFFNEIGKKDLNGNDFEVLGEKALPEGHVDILIKDARPVGMSRKIIVEVKINNATVNDVKQLNNYVNEIGNECILGIIIAKNFSKRTLEEAKNKKVACCTYLFRDINVNSSYTFEELFQKLEINFMNVG